GLPSIIGPFDAVDGRVQLRQTILDLSNIARVSAAKRQVTASTAEGSATVETSAQAVAVGYARVIRGMAIVAARRADSSLAAELSGTQTDNVLATNGVSLQVTLPVLDGFRREGRLTEQRAVAEESDVRAKDLRLQVAADVDGALLDIRSAAAQQMIARERLALAAQELSQARQRFQAGVAGN